MKISAVLILFSLSALTSAVAIARPVPDPAPAPESTKVPTTEPPIDLDAITDDTRGNVPDTVTLADDEVDDRAPDSKTEDHGIVARGDVEDVTILERDVIPDSLERRESLWERGLAALQRRETAVQATDRLEFSTSIGAFLAAKAAKNPGNLIWDDDGCSASPDRPGGFNFLHGCQRHDFGYRNFKAQGRFTSANRKRIDDQLKSDLYNECEKHGPIKRTVCKRLADTYYLAVRAAGGL